VGGWGALFLLNKIKIKEKKEGASPSGKKTNVPYFSLKELPF
jgi:hypothetical protein